MDEKTEEKRISQLFLRKTCQNRPSLIIGLKE